MSEINMSPLLLICVVLVFGPVIGMEVCKEKEWYDDLIGKCRKCQSCVDKSWQVAPCTTFMDTMCVDFAEISRSMLKNINAGKMQGVLALNHDPSVGQDLSPKHHRWHEMEGQVIEDPFPVKEKPVSKNLFDGGFDQWDVLLLTTLSLLFLFFIILVIMGAIKYYGNPLQWDHNKTTRNRLFSRDRLNTTEYMNNLATLDRRLAIDEILEKKKKAIFEPQLLKENIYTDEVFVDISGLPRNFRKSHDYEELDNKKCLLEMQDQH